MCVESKKGLYKGISQATIGNRTGDIGFAIQDFLERELKYHLVRELVGHGVGKGLHEDPEVPNYGKRGSGVKLQEGLVIAIEPMVNLGTRKVVQLNDGWTIVTADRSPSAHYELMVAVAKGGPVTLSTFLFIEEVEEANENLKPVTVSIAVK
jgi:methionyl aminopeptidase